jgi:hypothetical protein
MSGDVCAQCGNLLGEVRHVSVRRKADGKLGTVQLCSLACLRVWPAGPDKGGKVGSTT